MTIIDIHTHRNYPQQGAIVSLSPTQYDKDKSPICSVGIHPWDSIDISNQTLSLLKELSTLPNVVAIGECGIDRLKGADIESQTALFKQHIQLSEEVKKPLIIHAVKSANIILSLHRQYNPTQTWIIHGYRGNDTTAKQYLSRGIELSYGEKFNSRALSITPLEQLWIESDESTCDINDIYNTVAEILKIEPLILQQSIERRAKNLFFGCQ